MPFEAYDVEGRTVANKKTHRAGFQKGQTGDSAQQARAEALAFGADLASRNEFHRVIVYGPTELEFRDDEDIIWDSRVNTLREGKG